MSTKTALVSGANRGIGAEVAAQLGSVGYWVFLGARDVSSAEESAAEVERRGGQASVVQLDMECVGHH